MMVWEEVESWCGRRWSRRGRVMVWRCMNSGGVGTQNDW